MVGMNISMTLLVNVLTNLHAKLTYVNNCHEMFNYVCLRWQWRVKVQFNSCQSNHTVLLHFYSTIPLKVISTYMKCHMQSSYSNR